MIYLFFILAISLSIDALGAGIVYGIRNIKIPIISKLIICLFSIIYAGIAIYSGNFISKILPAQISSFIGIGILILLGLQMIIKARKPAKGDVDSSGTIDFKEALILGLALSIDSIGVGIGAGFVDIKSPTIPILIGLFQLFFLTFGSYLGKKFMYSIKLSEKELSIIAGLLLIVLALLRLINF